MTENVVPLHAAAWKEAQGLAARLRFGLDALTNTYADDLAGYVVLCVAKNGAWSLAFKTDAESPIGQTMLAGLAQAAIQRDMLGDSAAVEALVRNGLRAPPPEDQA